MIWVFQIQYEVWDFQPFVHYVFAYHHGNSCCKQLVNGLYSACNGASLINLQQKCMDVLAIVHISGHVKLREKVIYFASVNIMDMNLKTIYYCIT